VDSRTAMRHLAVTRRLTACPAGLWVSWNRGLDEDRLVGSGYQSLEIYRKLLWFMQAISKLTLSRSSPTSKREATYNQLVWQVSGTVHCVLLDSTFSRLEASLRSVRGINFSKNEVPILRGRRSEQPPPDLATL